MQASTGNIHAIAITIPGAKVSQKVLPTTTDHSPHDRRVEFKRVHCSESPFDSGFSCRVATKCCRSRSIIVVGDFVGTEEASSPGVSVAGVEVSAIVGSVVVSSRHSSRSSLAVFSPNLADLPDFFVAGDGAGADSGPKGVLVGGALVIGD